jgi:hypothetical protein
MDGDGHNFHVALGKSGECIGDDRPLHKVSESAVGNESDTLAVLNHHHPHRRQPACQFRHRDLEGEADLTQEHGSSNGEESSQPGDDTIVRTRACRR